MTTEDRRVATRRASRELVTIPEARRIAKVSRRTIYVWMTKHKLEWVRTAGGSVLIYLDSLIKPEPKP